MDENIQNAVENAFGDNVADMQSDIESALQYKIINALEQKRIQIAQSLINNENIDPDEGEEELEDIQELSKGTLQSYVNKRQWDMGTNEKMQKKMDTGLARAETKLKGDQHKLDKNKNGKIDAHDFKLLRKGNEVSFGEGWDDDEDDDVARADRELKRMKAKPIAAAKIDPDKDKIKRTKKDREEEMDEEYIEEISKKTLGSYVKKAASDIDSRWYWKPSKNEFASNRGVDKEEEKHSNKISKRIQGIGKASDKLTKESYIEELSKQTLGSYIKKAHKNKSDASAEAEAVNTRIMNKGSSDRKSDIEYKQKMFKRVDNRNKGIDKAVDRLAKEEYIEEVLSVSDGVDAWIHDFVHSDNPKFEGKSKKERIQMALGAFYSAKKGKTRNE